MARRLDVELTSTRPDGNYTWRAAGAKQPKGELDASLLPAGVGVGDVVRIEAVADLEGLTVTTVFAPKQQRPEPERLELLGMTRAEPPVTAVVTSRASLRSDRDDRGRRGRPRSAESKRRAKRRSRETDKKTDPESKRRAKRRSDAPGDDTDDKTDAGRNRSAGRRRRRDDDKRAPSRDRRHRDDHQGPARGEHPRVPRLRARRVHRAAALEALPEIQRELAGEVLRGGVPGVRETIDRMNDKATAEGIPKIKGQPLVALAEKMAPVLKAAEWRDRAEAALAGLDEVDLRDIRSVVSSAEAGARGTEATELAEQLRTGLAARVDREHRSWLNELSVTIAEGRTIRALRLSSHPPKAGSPMPVDLATRLSDLASAGLTADTGSTRWSLIIEAVAFSPVRNQVVPQGVPAEPSPELSATVRRLAPRVKALAGAFGIESPPTSPKGRNQAPPPPPREPAGTQDGDKATSAGRAGRP